MTDYNSEIGITKAQIDDIKERINIEDIVKRYVTLKPVGKNLFGVCPFHSEKTPSFSVNPELNLFKCYGCGESGDVISFLQKIETIEFHEAIEILAKEAGVTLSYKKKNSSEDKIRRRAIHAHDLACRFYRYLLIKHSSGKSARDYVMKRNISDKASSSFSIGYAPSPTSSISLSRFLQKEGFTSQELVDFGLCAVKGNGIYDKFVDRIMFPIQDASGTVVGFSGRVFRKDDNRPKYINSPESIVFQKRKLLFGLYQAKQAIRKNDFIICVEGQIDAISSWMAGIENVVAPLGTGITATQIDRMKRLTEHIAIAFDNDEAGIRAHYKFAQECYLSELSVTSVEIPYGKDVDECISHDPQLWIDAVEKRRPTVTYFLSLLSRKHDPQTLQGKQALITQLSPLLQAMKDTVSIDHHLKELHLITDIPLQLLAETIARPNKKNAPFKLVDKEQPIKRKSTQLSHDDYLLSLLLQYPEAITWAANKIDSVVIEDENRSSILQAILEQSEKSEPFNASHFILSLEPSSRELATHLLMQPLWSQDLSLQEVTDEIESTVRYMRIAKKKKHVQTLRKKMALAEQQDNAEEANKLLNSINDTLKDLESLQSTHS